jgi:hypothetical protein
MRSTARLIATGLLAAGTLAGFLPHSGERLFAQADAPRATLIPTTTLRLPGGVDSNSPAVWDLLDGRNAIYVFTSIAGQPNVASGPQARRLSATHPVAPNPWPGGGVWMEAVVTDVDGTWYGYYHNEVVAWMCGDATKVTPRIGAARSHDAGATWEPLGAILEAPPGSFDCETRNRFFVGGVGDLSVQLDPESKDLYIFFSQYQRRERQQGVSVARLAWADRDDPVGKIMVWNGRTWLPPSSYRTFEGQERWIFPSALPIFPALESFHDDDDVVDAFWGPSVHWNTYLERYVMLLNHAKDNDFGQEGIYLSYASKLDDPREWSTPVKLLDGGVWYPQVLGLEDGLGTDKRAARTARFFMGGVSRYFIQFTK